MLAASPFVQAQQNSTVGKTHSFEVGVGLADVLSDYENETSQDDYLYEVYRYQYHLDDQWAVGLSHTTGDTDDIVIFFHDLSFLRNIEYSATSVSVERAFELSTRWRLVGSVGFNHYDVDYSGRDLPEYDDSGVGYNASVGVEFRAHNGFGVAFEYNYIDMDKTQVKGPTLMLSWMF